MTTPAAPDAPDVTQRFLAFSAEVTAFTEFDLRGTGQAESYLSTVIRVVGEEPLTELLDAYERTVRATPGGLARQPNGDRSARARALSAEIFSSDKLGPIARNIIKLWYAGVWYELPSEWAENYGVREGDGTFTASPEAYPEALLWVAIGANPPGAKAPGYGSWAHPPVIPPIPGEETAPARHGHVAADVPRPRAPQADKADQSEQAEQAKETAQ
jgi:hypothetical protein